MHISTFQIDERSITLRLTVCSVEQNLQKFLRVDVLPRVVRFYKAAFCTSNRTGVCRVRIA